MKLEKATPLPPPMQLAGFYSCSTLLLAMLLGELAPAATPTMSPDFRGLLV